MALRKVTFRMAMIVSALFFFGSEVKPSLSFESTLRSPAQVTDAYRAKLRLSHAKELLGSRVRSGVLRNSQTMVDVDEFVRRRIQKSLKLKWKTYSELISNTVIHESTRYGFDPVFVLAVIANESNFDPEVIGRTGEVGLMQLAPDTGKWIAKKAGLGWEGSASLKDPMMNIRLGTAYLAYLRERFDFHSQLYISAYNMGSRKVRESLERNTFPRKYSTRILSKYLRFYAELEHH